MSNTTSDTEPQVKSADHLRDIMSVEMPYGCTLLIARLTRTASLVAYHGRQADGKPNGNVLFAFHFAQVEGEDECDVSHITLRNLSLLTDNELFDLIEDAPNLLADRTR